MNSESTDGETVTVQAWDPNRLLRRLAQREASLSRGFLRSRPERWLPGFGAHWLPLAHSLGSEARILEVKPTAALAGGLEWGFVASADGEPFAVMLDDSAVKSLSEEVLPGAGKDAQQIVLQYLVRRFVASLALSWSGPESSTVQFERNTTPSDITIASAIKVVVVFNTAQFTIWIGLGRRLTDRLDSLWRRQVHSTSKVQNKSNDVSVEIVQLGVPPQMLADYLRRDTVIDLETPASDTVVLRANGKAWVPGRLVDVEGRLGIETLPGAVNSPVLPEGTTRLSVQLLALTLDNLMFAEMSQVGAVYVAAGAPEDKVQLIINGEKVGEATLCTYEGRFAISVL